MLKEEERGKGRKSQVNSRGEEGKG